MSIFVKMWVSMKHQFPPEHSLFLNETYTVDRKANGLFCGVFNLALAFFVLT